MEGFVQAETQLHFRQGESVWEHFAWNNLGLGGCSATSPALARPACQ